MNLSLERTINELLTEFKMDPSRKTLFVEGRRDLSFWRRIVPASRRNNTIINTISTVCVPEAEGGERGRLKCLATATEQIVPVDRMRFFADADFDRLLSRVLPINMLITDGKDLESYLFNEKCFDKLLLEGLARDTPDVQTLLSLISDTGRKLGILRLVSEKYNLKLPFQKTFENPKPGLERYVKYRAGSIVFDFDKALTALIQNSSDIGLKQLNQIKLYHQTETQVCLAIPDHQLVHGKDLLILMAIILGIERDSAAPLLFLCFDPTDVRLYDNLNEINSWL